MNLRDKLEVVSLSDVGLKRDHNEDSIGTDNDIGLVILADGMGGYKAGEVASAIAVNVVMEEIRNGLQEQNPGELDEESGYTHGTLMLRDAISKANETIFNTAKRQPQCQGMGTTVVVVLFYNDRATVAHVGDSRLYRLRDGQFEQLTVDHSLLQELVDKGFYTPGEAKKSVQKNLVTRAMGVEATVKCDLQEEPVVAGDLYLACSDGLSDLVEDSDIHLTLNKYSANLEQVAQNLIQMANRSGGNDNISIILARTLKSFPATARSNWYSKVFNWFN
ncbi:MAG: Stp1/IreP family PP2C-type Ser/Thr phosphatase [Gammaproteobacteria bacterium]|nr:Stp1/IreP family PP2C-type Ser/Thr phosphatase [Gammaproteobacteria bacterium]